MRIVTLIAGATAASYTTPVTTTGDDGDGFYCEVSNAAGAVNSATATLTVTSTPVAPSITTQPADQTVAAGQTATFTVAADGTAPLSYQWRKDTVNIAGATSASYTTPPTTSTDDQSLFDCVVNNAVGSATSATALLTVTANVLQNSGFESGTSGWKFYTNAIGSFTVAGPGDGSPNAAVVTTTTVGTNIQLFQYNIPLEPNTDYQLKFSAYSNTGHDFRVSLAKHGAPYTNYGLNRVIADLATGWQAYTFNFTTKNFSIPVSDARLSFWFASDAAPGDQFRIDNVTLATAGSSPPVAPSITTQPADRTVNVGQTATFTVAADGTAPLSYQWRKGGVDIPGATSASYTTPPTVLADDGALFDCVVDNPANDPVTSRQALLTVTDTPPGGENVLLNSGFESGTSGWQFYTNAIGSFTVAGPGDGSPNAAVVTTTTVGTNIQLFQYNIPLEPNTDYQLKFSAYSNTGHDFRVSLAKHGAPYTNYGLNRAIADLATGWQAYTFNFTTKNFSIPVSDARLSFWFASDAAPGDQFRIDNVTLATINP